MKHTFYYLLVLLSVTYLTSCSTDSLEELDLKKDIPETVTGSDDPEKDPTPKDDPKEAPAEKPIDEPKKDPLASCDDFDWSNIIDSKITIDCVINLNGKTIEIPSNTSVIYEGGDVKNGTLNFASNGKIDGELLSASLDLNGDVQLSKDEFEFIPSRWEIVEGRVNNEVARKNRDLFEENMITIKNLGAQKYIINKMDAYFKVDEPSGRPVPSLGAINVPSDYHLLMSDNTHIRMQPNSYRRPNLLAVHRVSNVTIEGGILHGDRDEHDYSSGGTHEWVHTLQITGSTNIIIKNITSMDAGGDGITISSYGHAFDPHYTPSDNILITDSKIIRSRRNGIASGDGRNVIIENNDFIDVGTDTNKSKGTPPRMAIDIEAQNRDGITFQIARDFTIRNNREKGSGVMAFFIASGFNIIIENNVTESPISYFGTHNSIIRNNVITAATDRQRNNITAISAGATTSDIENFNNKIYGNTIKGYAFGIDIVNFDNEVYDNKLINCHTGIILNSLKDSKVYNNKIISTTKNSIGIATKPNTEYINNVIVENNNVDVLGKAFRIQSINEKPSETINKFKIINNIAKSNTTSSFDYMSGLEFSQNKLIGGMRLVGAKNSIFSDNEISTNGAIGIDFSSENNNITAINNLITINVGEASCIRDKENNIDLKLLNNTCN